MKVFCLCINPKVNLDKAWSELTDAGFQLLYSSEDPCNGKEIYGLLPEDFPSSSFLKTPLIDSIHPTVLVEPNWHEQWEAHGMDYHDGFVHICLEDFGFIASPPSKTVVKLEPGPGFGDLSHPTTSLVLEMMSKHVKDQVVVDVGCGSGVLALCAIAMKARKAYGLDIDVDAIRHARQNAILNGMELSAHFFEARDFNVLEEGCSVIIAMNMIRSEQMDAWNHLKKIHRHVSSCFTSGILAEERDLYLALAASWGWTLKEEIKKDQWLGFQFSKI